MIMMKALLLKRKIKINLIINQLKQLLVKAKRIKKNKKKENKIKMKTIKILKEDADQALINSHKINHKAKFFHQMKEIK